jgi:hypothetical protein
MRLILACLTMAMLLATALDAQTIGARVRSLVTGEPGYDAPYDGRFTFARIRFTPLGGDGGFGQGRDLKWDHDYPRAERNFVKILSEVSVMRPYMEGSNILTLDDPNLFKYPIAYLCEPGFWTLTPAESAAMRAYLLKGGFVIVDDFAGSHWYNFAEQMRQVMPEARMVELDVSHPIFDSFYRIESLEFTHPNFGLRSQFFGIFEDNDQSKRLMMIINYNNDIGDYWEWSDAGYLPIDLSNQAYKLGVNYIMYAMTR